MSDVVLRVEGLGKSYRKGAPVHRRYRTLKADAHDFFARTTSSAKQFWALRDVSFDLHRGEVIGILGRNGAGKSTLLRIIARLTKPTMGSVTISGRVGTLIATGLGMHQELTGRENIYVAGALVGMSKKEIDQRFNDIVAFAEMEDFLDIPFKRYSSGMRSRLSFSTAIHLDHADILLIDEVLAAGDLAFKAKCKEKLAALIRDGRSVLIVSHSPSFIKRIADRCLYLERGEVVAFGPTQEVFQKYVHDLFPEKQKHVKEQDVPMVV